jgi:hypothetical protein
LFNPETVERHRKDGVDYVRAAKYDLLLQRYREAVDCLLGMVGSNTDAMCVLHKAGLTKNQILQMKTRH